MPTTFPATPTFSGFNTPVRAETELFDLEVTEGAIPADLSGTFYRCGPDPQFPPKLGTDIYLNGDGMVTMFRFADGHVDMRSRYVRTEKFQRNAPRAKLCSVPTAIRSPMIRALPGKSRGTANTNVLWHGGKLLALKEDSPPVQIDPDTLETIGPWTFDGALTSLTATAHPKIDPVTGELFFYGFAARAKRRPTSRFTSPTRAARSRAKFGSRRPIRAWCTTSP